jgi:NAD(P)-dependent dehydrogenase (short-subunit alcohol dehydrogenase family)
MAGHRQWEGAAMRPDYSRALIVGAGAGLSASLARAFAGRGMGVDLAARGTSKLADLSAETGAGLHACDTSDAGAVAALFAALDAAGRVPDVVVYNPSARVRGPIATLDPKAVAHAVSVTALGAFYVAREAAIRMERAGTGAILLTGASAGVKGFAQSAPFAMGKFALRGLAQSMARELHPKGIHVGHFVIDGAIRNPGREEPADAPDSMLDPDAIAQSYCAFLDQDRSCWAWEIELRPWVERF